MAPAFVRPGRKEPVAVLDRRKPHARQVHVERWWTAPYAAPARAKRGKIGTPAPISLVGGGDGWSIRDGPAELRVGGYWSGRGAEGGCPPVRGEPLPHLS